MSNHYYLECPEHDKQTDGINHGDDMLRWVWDVRHLLANMLTDPKCAIEVTIPSYGTEHINFVIEHEWCDVVLHDEYGHEAVHLGPERTEPS